MTSKCGKNKLNANASLVLLTTFWLLVSSITQRSQGNIRELILKDLNIHFSWLSLIAFLGPKRSFYVWLRSSDFCHSVLRGMLEWRLYHGWVRSLGSSRRIAMSVWSRSSKHQCCVQTSSLETTAMNHFAFICRKRIYRLSKWLWQKVKRKIYVTCECDNNFKAKKRNKEVYFSRHISNHLRSIVNRKCTLKGLAMLTFHSVKFAF